MYVDVDSSNLGFPYFNFLGGYQWKKHPVNLWLLQGGIKYLAIKCFSCLGEKNKNICEWRSQSTWQRSPSKSTAVSKFTIDSSGCKDLLLKVDFGKMGEFASFSPLSVWISVLESSEFVSSLSPWIMAWWCVIVQMLLMINATHGVVSKHLIEILKWWMMVRMTVVVLVITLAYS